VAAPTARFRRSQRLLRSPEYEHVAQHGRRAVSNAFVVLAAPGGDDGPRLGITASRKVGNAVARNRVKRRIREWFRRERPRLPALDLVVIARAPATRLESDEVRDQLSALVLRAAGRA